jgi:hypothetical protein
MFSKTPLYIIITVFSISLAIAILHIIYRVRKDKLPKEIVPIVTIFFSISTISILFPVITYLLQLFQECNFFFKDIKDGNTSLRIAMFLVGFKLFIIDVSHFLPDNSFLKKFAYPIKNFPEASILNETLPEKQFLLSHDMQGFLYIISIIIFGFSNNFDKYDLLLRTCLIFIIDDWSNIYKYSYILKGRMLRFDIVKILILNVIILALSLYLTMQNQGYYFILISFQIIFFISIYLFLNLNNLFKWVKNEKRRIQGRKKTT